MEEYEIDLRDYLRVMWRKKWIILGVFLTAILIAGLLSFKMPSQYETQALLRINPLPQITDVQLQEPSLQSAVIMLKTPDLLLQTVKKAKLDTEADFQDMTPQQIADWLGDHLKVNIPEKTNLLEVRLDGSLAPELLEKILREHLSVFLGHLQADLTRQAQREIARLKTEEKILAAQKDSLVQEIEGEIAARRKILKQQRDDLRRQLAAIMKDKSRLALQAGEQNATLEGIILREEFTALNDQLQQIESEIALLDRKGREEFPELNSRIQDLDQQISALEISIAKTAKLFTSSWVPMDIISQPTVPIAPIGPNRKMNIAVAGVLGLFIGVLLAFFMHYMEGGEPRSEPEVTGEPKGEGEPTEAPKGD